MQTQYLLEFGTVFGAGYRHPRDGFWIIESHAAA